MTLTRIIAFIVIVSIAITLLKNKSKKSLIIALSVIILIIVGGLWFLFCFLNALKPPDVTVTRDYIATNCDFINGVTIEKIQVDSIGDEDYPVKYTTFYTTSCRIHYRTGRSPEPPSKIVFSKPGKYSWDEDTVKMRYVHNGLSRRSLDTTSSLWWLNKFGDYPVCPISFEKGQWYFITIGDPRVTGIFFYIDENNKEHQYYLESGVSPI